MSFLYKRTNKIGTCPKAETGSKCQEFGTNYNDMHTRELVISESLVEKVRNVNSQFRDELSPLQSE